MKILAVDSGLEKTGFAVFNSRVLVISGLIKTDKKDRKEIRFLKLYSSLKNIFSKQKPSMIVFEQLYFYKNLKTAVDVAQAQGIIFLLAAQENVPTATLTPLQIKQAITGYGKADKKAIQKMLRLILKIDTSRMEDDESDAIACGLAYCYQSRNTLQ